MTVVPETLAAQEIESWLDYKKISDRKRETNADTIASMTEAISEGVLTLDSNSYVLTHKLKFPVGTEVETKELKIKPRVKVGDIHQQMKGVKATDVDERIIAILAALTDKPKAFLKSLDAEDYSVLQNIAIFFI